MSNTNLSNVSKKSLSIPIKVHVDVNPDARDAYAESLKLILQHVADFHLTVVDIISEKYKISVDEIMKTVTSDSRYTNMVVNPEIHRLTSLNQCQDRDCGVEKKLVETSFAETLAPPLLPPPSEVIKKTTEKKIRIRPKNVLLS